MASESWLTEKLNFLLQTKKTICCVRIRVVLPSCFSVTVLIDMTITAFRWACLLHSTWPTDSSISSLIINHACLSAEWVMWYVIILNWNHATRFSVQVSVENVRLAGKLDGCCMKKTIIEMMQ